MIEESPSWDAIDRWIARQGTRSIEQWRDINPGQSLRLKGASLRETRLAYAKLSGEDLSEVDFSGADLFKADLRGANLRGANLTGAIIIDADFRGADLHGADLSASNLSNIDFSNANLSKADLSRSNLNSANLNHATLDEATLRDTIAVHADLRGASLIDATLIGANLSGVDLTDAKLNRAKLTRAILSHAKLPGVQLNGAEFSGLKLSGAELHQADLRGTDLSGARLDRAKLNGANLSNANLNGADLNDAILDDAELRGTRLVNTNLAGCQLTNTDFRDSPGAEFDSNDLSTAKLHGASYPWLTLRRAYSGPMVLLHALLLLIFFSPFLARGALHVASKEFVDIAQQAIDAQTKASPTERANLVAERTGPIDDASPRELEAALRSNPLTDKVSDAVFTSNGRLATPMPRVDLKQKMQLRDGSLLSVLFETDRPFGVLLAILVSVLTGYASLRFFLVWKVAPMREEEDRTRHTPAKIDYLHLMTLHRFAKVLFWVSLVSTTGHLIDWMARPVYVAVAPSQPR